MRDRAADRAAGAGLEVTDPGERGGEQRRSVGAPARRSSAACRTAAGTTMASASRVGAARGLRRMTSTSTVGFASRMFSIGMQRLPAGEDARIGALPASTSSASSRLSART